MRHHAAMPDEISVAETDEDYAEFGELVVEYWTWLQDRYEHLPGFIDGVGGHQALDAELAGLREKYGSPNGLTLLARTEGAVSGGGALMDLGGGVCEMKRVFVRDAFQGRGLGRRLCQALLEAAVTGGYERMCLDTGYQNSEAIAMYRSMGFVDCPPYRDYPDELLAHLRFMEKALTSN
jgi:GNAT superfamily N-acetyltransferase